MFTLLLSFFCLPDVFGQEKKKEEEAIYIPEEVKWVMEEGLSTRQPRLDIPFEIVRFLYLPAQQNVHAVFLFGIKNADLDFTMMPTLEEKKEEKIEEIPQEEPQFKQISFRVFVQFYERKKGNIGEVVRESYIPASFQEESSAYKLEKENIYSIGYPLPPGDYLLALAITSPDLDRIGLQYHEFSLPDALSFQENLGLTPVFFMESFKQHEQPEIVTKVHKTSFVYSTLEIVPKIKNIFSLGESLDIFFYIYGCKPEPGTNQHNIEIKYQVKKGEESVIKYKEKSFNFPLISHPIPVLKQDDQPPEPGSYVLEININDKISGRALTENVEFEIK